MLSQQEPKTLPWLYVCEDNLPGMLDVRRRVLDIFPV